MPLERLRKARLVFYAVTLVFEEVQEMGAASAISVCRIAPKSVSNLPGRYGSRCRRIHVLE
jgi:hypothetical protein